MVQGPPPWTDCSKVHFWPDLDDMAPTPSDSSRSFSARLAAANRAVATLPPADLHLWTDGSVAANGDGGTGFAVFIPDKLRLSEAHPVGQGLAELRTEAEALRLGLQAALDLQDYSTFHIIRVLTVSQSLVRRLASGPARQSDSTCSTIWTLLSAASVQNTVDVQWIPAHVGKEGNYLADSEAKRGSTLPQPAASLDYITASATLVTNQHAIAATRYDSDAHTEHPPSIYRQSDMEHPHRCWPQDWTRYQCVTVAQLRTDHSPLLVDGLPAPHQTSRLGHFHIAMVLTRRQNIWCYTAQHTTRHSGSHGQISTIKATQDNYGASWRRSGR